MKKLNGQQSEEMIKHIGEIERLRDELEKAISELNDAMAEKYADIEAITDELNTAIADANDFRQNMADLMQEYYDERSEKWQQGEAGDAYSNWLDEWNQELYEVSVDAYTEIDVPDCEALDALNSMATEVTAE